MNKDLLDKISDFKNLLDNDSRVLALNEAEKAMEMDEEVMSLAYQKDLAETAYSDALRHHGEQSREGKATRKKLFEAKSKLDKHPLVRTYLEAYRGVRILYEEINEVLFAPFTEHFCEDRK
ncbi:MAG: YlbF family regulator [Bacilli bacterium]|jgi:cell fate (sporulation/competence/biofilm development) regulator YlbF (YheA/YmcA/DUF963 family)